MKALILIPSTDFDPSEAAVPWKILASRGVEVDIATPGGTRACCDQRMLTGSGLGPWSPLLRADANGVQAYEELARSPAFESPLRWERVDSEAYSCLILPGGHAPGMKPYLESPVLQKLVAEFSASGKLLAAICHGVVLAARSGVLRGKRATALLASQELSAWGLTCLWLGSYYRTYPETVQAEVTRALGGSGSFEKGPLPLKRDSLGNPDAGFFVKDGNLLTARWPGDAHRFGLEIFRLIS
jgi:protease I